MPPLDRLERLLAAEPNDPFVLYAIAQEHARLGHWDRAVEFYDRCLAADPAYVYAYYHKARALDAGGNRSGAVAALRAGLDAAKRAGDAKAAGEIASLLDELGP